MNIVGCNSQYLSPDSLSLYQFIEKIGRTCYKSEDKITEESAVGFVLDTLLARGHLAMLEHAHVFFNVPQGDYVAFIVDWLNVFKDIQGLRYLNMSKEGSVAYISGSVTAFLNLFKFVLEDNISRINVEKNFLYDFVYSMKYLLCQRYRKLFGSVDTVGKVPMMLLSRVGFIENVKVELSEPARSHVLSTHLPHTLLLTVNRGVTHEIVRHRVASFAQESTRYVNYVKEKYGSSIVVTEPPFFEPGTEAYDIWKDACEYAERAYMKLTKDLKLPAQQARDVLPHSTKADIIVTATETEWQHIINLRYHGTTGAPHPEMREVMCIAYPQLVEASEGRLK